MKGARLTLAILLGASVLLNAALLVRKPESAPAPGAPARPPGPAVAPLPASETPTARIEALEARIRQLEAERAEPPGATSAAPGRLAAFRDAVRKHQQIQKKLRDDPGRMDRETQLEFSTSYLELMKVLAQRSKDPALYVDAVRSYYEIALEEAGKPLTPEQKERMGPLLDGYAAELRQQAAAPALDRFVRELESERSAFSALDALLSPEQREGTQNASSMLGSSGFGGMQWVERKQAETQLVRQWTGAYGTDDVQQPALQRAAASYVAALDRLRAGFKGEEGLLWGNGARAHEFRVASARAQVEAIRLFQGALTAEQLERLRTRTPTELRIYDPKALQVDVEEEEE